MEKKCLRNETQKKLSVLKECSEGKTKHYLLTKKQVPRNLSDAWGKYKLKKRYKGGEMGWREPRGSMIKPGRKSASASLALSG